MASFIFPLLYGLGGMLTGSLLRLALLRIGVPARRGCLPTTEGLLCLLSILCCLVHGPEPYSALCCLLFALLLAAARIDAAFLYIPDEIPILIVLLSVICAASGFLPVPSPACGILLSPAWRLAGALSCGGILLVLRVFTRGGVGLGDVKLMSACGLFLGPPLSLLALFGAYALAGIWYAPLLLLGKVDRKTPVPMAPFFFVSLSAAVLWGEAILRWYTGIFLFL